MITNNFYMTKLGLDTQRVYNSKSGEYILITKSTGEFGQFVKILEKMNKLNLNDSTYYDGDSSEDEDEDGNENENEYDSGSGSDYNENGDIELGDMTSNNDKNIHQYSGATVRNRVNNSKFSHTLCEESEITENSDRKNDNKKKEEWYGISDPGIFKNYQVFKCLRGMDGVFMYYIKKRVLDENKESINSNISKEKKEAYMEIFQYCRDNFSNTMDYCMLIDSFINDTEEFLKIFYEEDRSSNSNDVTISIEKINEEENQNNNNNNNNSKLYNSQKEYLLNVLEKIKQKRKDFITYEYDFINTNNNNDNDNNNTGKNK